MFKVSDKTLVKQINDAESNYVIQKNDYIQIEIFTNKGERIVDPNFELTKETGTIPQTQNTVKNYLIDINGIVKLPLINEIKLEGLTIRKAEEIVQEEYAKFYEQPFVVLRFVNKRVIVLGSPGGQVIPLANENIRLVEVLALARGINNDGKAHNIRVLRNNEVYLADFSTFEGYQKNNIIIQPGDIVYVEPVRRAFIESLRDYTPVLAVFSSMTTLIIVIFGLNN
jgi:polysaccharide export outer membrane protein